LVGFNKRLSERHFVIVVQASFHYCAADEIAVHQKARREGLQRKEEFRLGAFIGGDRYYKGVGNALCAEIGI
jgi:hypothetical protein